MNKIDFINKVVGVKYINRGYGFDGCDCFGLVYLYYKHVKSNTINLSDEYLNYEDFATSFTSQLLEWEEVDLPIEGDCCFVSFSNGIPGHCGVMVSKNEVLHSFGSEHSDNGQVLLWKLRTMIKVMGSEIKYYRPRIDNV